MKVLVFDVETTGLPIGKNPSIFETDKWPYIVQLSYIMYDTTVNEIDIVYNEILKLPNYVEISDESIKLHKITEKINYEIGVDRRSSLQTFNLILEQSDIVVGHNISFDKRMIMVECNRNNVYHRFNKKGVKKTEYCTMKNSVDICKIEKTTQNGKTYFKYPTLSELYYYLFEEVPVNAHNSFVDVLLCLRCYVKLNNESDIMITNELFNELMKCNSVINI